MVIVIKNADYSANNIGKVEVKRYLNPFTLAAINASGNQSMTNEQKSALDTFFEEIGAFGNESEIWSKLDKVYIPFLCSSLSNACINYKTNKSDKDLSAERYTLRNGGITGVVKSQETYVEQYLEENIAINTRNLSLFGIVMESDASLTNDSCLVAYEGNSGSNRWATSLSRTGNGDTNLEFGGVRPSGNLNANVAIGYPTAHKLLGINIRAVNDITYVKVNSMNNVTSTSSFLEATGIDTPAKSLGIFTNSARAAMSSNAPSVGMMLLGKGLTDAELILLKSASETLVDFFK